MSHSITVRVEHAESGNCKHYRWYRSLRAARSAAKRLHKEWNLNCWEKSQYLVEIEHGRRKWSVGAVDGSVYRVL